LYTFGEADGGKLGLGDDPDEVDTPQKVDLPEPATAVACGGSHTVVVTGTRFHIRSSSFLLNGRSHTVNVTGTRFHFRS